ncbi:MAG: helix-turn-helix transcriptional regulator [Oscillospiraceae bacterium]
MYTNLKENLHKKGITVRSYAEFLGVSEKTVQNKIRGATDFTLTEAEKTRRVLFPEYDMFFLFKSDTHTN